MKLLRHRIAQVYYTHGLFCASHPYSILITVCTIILITCYPLINLPLPGNAPQEFKTQLSSYSVPSRVYTAAKENEADEDLRRPRWYVGPPVGYVQQFVIKSVVSPWHPQQLIPTDAFRAPLSRVFQVLREVESFQHQTRDGMQAIQDICLHISEPISSGHIKNLLPQYSCFMVSPANLWHSDHRRFNKDPEIIKTVYQKYGQTIETPPTIKDLLFGLPWKDTGISRYFIRNRQRVISYAITIILKKYDKGFINALRERLERAFPETSLNVNNTEVDSLVHVHYKDFNYIVEYTPLLVTYFVLLLYIYFSVRKIEMVKSQFGLAISAVVTVVSSLFMSLSLCFFFGLNPTLNGSEIFPYLVMLIGLENVLVITKSVVSTPVHLDVKIRVAQGLSKEGWYITKNLCTELFIIFIGFFTFVPAIQEFCLFALVGLWTDFFLQMLFFATILSVDIRRMELADLHRQSVQQGPEQDLSTPIQPLIQCPFASRLNPPKRPSTPCTSSHPNFDRVSPAPSAQGSAPYSPISSPLIEDLWHSTPKIYRSKSAPRLDIECSQPLSQTAPQQSQEAFFQNMPRRLRLFYFWARTRIFQRLIMVCTVIWIALIVYKTGLVEQLTNLEDSSMSSPATGQQHLHPWGDHPFSSDMMRDRSLEQETDSSSLFGKGMWWGREGGGEEPLEAGLVEHTQLEAWRGLSHKHWPRLLALYNISILGRYISILPSIHLSVIVDAQVALQERHPSESQGYLLPSQSLPTQESHSSTENKQNIWSYSSDNTQYTMYNPEQLKAFYPKSRREFVITICLGVLSVIVITYFMVALYKCMCSRNYSRWRHSLARYKARRQRAKGTYYKQIKDAVPIILTGHNQEIECVAVDGQFIVSCCLGGQLRMWDSNTGECISIMQRYSITPPRRRRPCVGRNIEDSDADLYAEYHGDKMTPESTSSSEGSFIDRNRLLERRSERNRHIVDRYCDLGLDLVSSINTDFVAMDPQPDADHTQGYDFKRWLDGVSTEHFQLFSDVPPANRKIPSADDGNCTVLTGEDVRVRSWSQGDSAVIGDPLLAEDGSEGARASAIWCLTVKDGLIIAGCGNGRIEMWEGETGRLKYQYNVSLSGVTAVCFTGNRIIAARVDGSLDVFELETFQNSSVHSPSSSVSARPHRGHTRQYSAGNLRPLRLWEEVVRLNCIASFRAHQRPITCLQCEGNRIVTASQDHTLKVYRLDGRDCLYTLYGHEDHVTALCLDKCPPYAATSGSADGTMRLWDLVTGSCIHKFMWHKQAIIRLATSLQFIVSLGQDDCMCVLDRTRGQLLHKISMESFGSSLVLMPHNLAVTGTQGKLELWDLSRGCLVRPVPFQDGDSAFITHLETLNSNSLVCAAGISLKVISFPTTLEKAE